MMISKFPLFQSHLDLAHEYWKMIVRPEDLVIDATCGNGHDTLLLANLAHQGTIYGLDVQSAALTATNDLLSQHFPDKELLRIKLVNQCHSSFPDEVVESSVKLIVYNLGYLPAGDKAKTTQTETTLKSLIAAQKLIVRGGIISITCYPGHPEGALEEAAILEYSAKLNPREWSSCHHRWLNRQKSPSLLILQRNL